MSPAASSRTRPDDAARRRKKRPRPLPHVMARNLAIEKKRREQMNGNFLDLAHLVPALAHTQRLTKVHIVSQTIAHLREQRELCGAAARAMQALLADNSLLRSSGGVSGGRAEEEEEARSVMARLLAVSRLGSGGTATLRDAHEGPEPKSRAAPAAPSVEMVDAGRRQQGATGQGGDTLAQYEQSLWNTGYDFTGIPEVQQKQFLWSCPMPSASPESSSLLAPSGVPTPPNDSFGLDVMTSPAYPTFILPDDNLYSTRVNEAAFGDIWAGLGT